MALGLAEAGSHFSRHRQRWIGALVAGYAVYRACRHPSVARRRRQLVAVIRAVFSLANAVASSAETSILISADLNRFLRSESDEHPPSLIQLSKLARSGELSASVSRISEALTIGIVRGLSNTGKKSKTGSDFSDRVLDKIFSERGKEFASVVVCSFARNLVLAFYSRECGDQTADGLRLETLPELVRLICNNDKCRDLLTDSIRSFASTAVAVYADSTKATNSYDELLSELTNPKHEEKVKDILVSVCNGAVETLVKTSHQVITTSSSSASGDKAEYFKQEEQVSHELGDKAEYFKHEEQVSHELRQRDTFREKSKLAGGGDGGWVDKVSSALAVPRNRKFVLDVTGRVTFETVRSLFEFFLRKLYDGCKSRINVMREEVVDSLRDLNGEKVLFASSRK